MLDRLEKNKVEYSSFFILVPFEQRNIFHWVNRVAFSYFLCFHFLACAFIWGDSPQAFEMILESDNPIVYEDDNATITARQNASLRGTDFLVLADQIKWNRRSGDAIAIGSVSLTRGNSRILADEAHFSTKTGNFMAINTRGGTMPKYFIAEKIESNASVENYYNASLYLSEPGKFEPNFSTTMYTVDKNESNFKIAPSYLRIGNTLVGILPGYSGTKENGLFGLSSVLKVGKDKSLGWYGEKSFSYRWQELTSVAKFTYYQNRGILLSPQISFAKTLENGFFSSRLNGGWTNDRGENRGSDNRNIPLDRNRGYAHFNNTARFHDRLRSSTLVEWESDSEIIRDYRRSTFHKNQWNQSHNELSYEGNGYTISILSRWQSNKHESVVEHLPFLSFDSGPSKIGNLNFFQSSTVNYASIRRRNEFGIASPSIQRMNLGYKLEQPLPLGNGVQLTPSAGWMYQDYQFNNSSLNRFWGEYGIDLHASLYQPIPFRNQTWEIDQLLHLTKFSLGLRCTEQLSGDSLINLPEVYPEVENLNLSPLDLLDYRNSELINEKKLIRLGWENYL
ncbi:MAG: hypothetical protein VW576_07760, partial [Opitutae bacterium]